MAQPEDAVTVEEVVTLEDAVVASRRLSISDKVRLIARVASEIENELPPNGPRPSRSLLGIMKGLGPVPSEEDIDAARREAWSGFPRDDIGC